MFVVVGFLVVFLVFDAKPFLVDACRRRTGNEIRRKVRIVWMLELVAVQESDRLEVDEDVGVVPTLEWIRALMQCIEREVKGMPWDENNKKSNMIREDDAEQKET